MPPLRVALAACTLLAGAAHGTVVQTKERDLKVGSLDYIRMNSLTSRKTMVPLDYYTLPFIKPTGGPQRHETENLGQILIGDRLYTSPYIFFINHTVGCIDLQEEGTKHAGKVLSNEDIKEFANAIENNYRINMIYENMDAWTDMDAYGCIGGNESFATLPLAKGVRVGGCFKDAVGDAPKQYFLNTHLGIEIFYSTPEGKPEGGSGVLYVLRLRVTHKSRADGCNSGPNDMFVFTRKDRDRLVKFSYSVTWTFENKKWPSRWDEYVASMDTEETEIKNAILYSVLLIVCLTFIVAVIIMRVLHIDFNRYNNPDNPEEMQEEVGWKLVHTDVFRPPTHPNRFCGLLGTGAHLLGMCTAGLGFSLIGFMSPGARGILLAICLFVFAVFAVLNGYICGRFQMAFGCKQWKTPILSGLLYPGFVFMLWTITEIALSTREGATTAVEFSVVLQLMILWWGISLPLVILGAASAFKQEPMKPPIPYRSIPRSIPPQSWALSKYSAVLVPGLVSFVTFMVVLKLIVESIWLGRVYILFGYVLIIAILAVITIAETTIVFIYYQLVYEDYRWWWKSFLCGSGIGWYFLVWSLYYGFTVLDLQTGIAKWLFFVFSVCSSTMLMLVAGYIGFYVCWLFTRKIYNSIKIE